MNSYIWITLVLAGVYVGFLICAAITHHHRTRKSFTVTCSRCVIPMVRVLPELVGIEGVEEYVLHCVRCRATITLDFRPITPLRQKVRKLVAHV